MAQQQLNLSAKAIVALLQALNALNLNSADASSSAPVPTRSAAPNDGQSVDDATTRPLIIVAPSPSPVPVTGVRSPATIQQPAASTTALQPMASTSAAAQQPIASTSSTRLRALLGQQPPAQIHSGFHCSHCGAFNPTMGQSGETWYVVPAGHQVGIFANWEVVQPLMSGVAHACHKKYKTHAEAEEAFETTLTQGKVHVL